MMTLTVGTLFILLAAGPAAPAPSDDMRTLVDTENAFAAMAGQKGIKTAFLAYMDEDAIVFIPEPVPALSHYEGRKKQGDLLYWVPEFVQITGDLGWTTGPWEYRERMMQEQPVATGHFVTVWKKQKDGTWKWLLDAGVSHTLKHGVKSAEVAQTLATIVIGPPLAREERDRQAGLILEAERFFSKGAGKTWRDLPYSGDRAAWIFREGSPVVMSGAEGRSFLTGLEGEVRFAPAACGVSGNGGLAYSWGTGSFRPAGMGPAEPFAYLHIWERQKDGSWKIVADLTNPIPPKK